MSSEVSTVCEKCGAATVGASPFCTRWGRGGVVANWCRPLTFLHQVWLSSY